MPITVVRLAGAVPSSLPVNVNVASVFVVVTFGCPVMVVSGAVVSRTMKTWLSGWPTFPASSIARTWKVCWPGLSWVVSYDFGLAQALYAAPSIRHSKVELASSEEIPNVGVESLVVPAGPESMVGSGYPCPGGALYFYDIGGEPGARTVDLGGVYAPDDIGVNAVGAAGFCTPHVFDISSDGTKLATSWHSGGIRYLDISKHSGYTLGTTWSSGERSSSSGWSTFGRSVATSR